jgi:DNA-binding response OmpR family regulator
MRETQPSPIFNAVGGLGTNFPVVPVAEIPASGLMPDPAEYRHMVLVVDDDAPIADTLVEILNKSGYAAIAAYDGEGGLETARLMPPELLISDVGLPGINGVALAAAVTGEFPDCKVLLFSGEVTTEDLLAPGILAARRFKLLNKPLDPEVLLKDVAETLGTPRVEIAKAGGE